MNEIIIQRQSFIVHNPSTDTALAVKVTPRRPKHRQKITTLKMKPLSGMMLLLQLIFIQAFAPKILPSSEKISTKLYGGIGIAKSYSWKEEQYEIELKVRVPESTKAKEIKYEAKSKSISLQVGDEMLLDGSRKMRGMIDIDGTFWSLLDSDEHDGRDLVITIEKLILPPNDPFEVVEFDWGGIYPDDEDEIEKKTYDEPEELDVREYAASLGVDIDNINMTMVDKNMFSSGLNMTRSTLDEMTKAGYVKEVTRQGNQEFLDDGAENVPFRPLGDNIGSDEISAAGIDMNNIPKPSQNPYMTQASPWLQTMPVEEARTDEMGTTEQSKDITGLEEKETNEKSAMKDPIDLLTVTKLKEVLRREGLKVSGNKEVLKERLKSHVQTVMNGQKEQRGDQWQ